MSDERLLASACRPVLTTALAFDLADEHLQAEVVAACGVRRLPWQSLGAPQP